MYDGVLGNDDVLCMAVCYVWRCAMYDGVLARRHTQSKLQHYNTTSHERPSTTQSSTQEGWVPAGSSALLRLSSPHLHEEVPKNPQRSARGGDVERHEPRLAAARYAEFVSEIRLDDVVLRFHDVVLPVEHKGEVGKVVVVAARTGETK